MRGMQRTENVNLQIHEEEVGRANNDFRMQYYIMTVNPKRNENGRFMLTKSR